MTQMTTQTDPAAELASLEAELAAQEKRLVEVRQEIAGIDLRRAALVNEANNIDHPHAEFTGIRRLRNQVESARLKVETSRLPIVRVDRGISEWQWHFVKRTPKRIYLRSIDSLASVHWIP